ncbi:hypothetical protein D3C81_1634490 [compost metagenome]
MKLIILLLYINIKIHIPTDPKTKKLDVSGVVKSPSNNIFVFNTQSNTRKRYESKFPIDALTNDLNFSLSSVWMSIVEL